jgi:hypothetical protein
MDNVEKVLRLIEDGSPIAGAATGAAVGVVSGGPLGAAFGAALGGTVGKIIEDAASRSLSRRERVRVGAAACYAIEFTRERFGAGDRPREDKFFENFEYGASTADEIFDGVLTKAKSDHEERKARFYGKFFCNVAFDVTCSRTEANYFLHLLDQLTYSQLVLMALFAARSGALPLPCESYEYKKINSELSQILLATFELLQLGLLKLWVTKSEQAEAVLDMADIRPGDIGLSTPGKRLFALAGLGLLPEQERTDVADILRSAECPGGGVITAVAKLVNN